MDNSITLPAWISIFDYAFWIPDLLIFFGIYLVTRTFTQRKNLYFIIAALVIFFWHLVIIYLAKSGFFHQIPIPIITIIGVIASYILFIKVRPFSKIVENMPVYWFVLIQIFRIFGGVFFILYLQNHLPGAFALPAGLGDVFIGLTAIWVTYLLIKESPIALTAAKWWAILGILDLVLAMTMGILTSPIIGGDNVLISTYPLAIISAFRVPFMFTLHLILLKKIRMTNR